MPKPKAVHPKVVLNVWLPPDIRTRLDLMLFSEVEGRVPHGTYSRFFEERIREYLEWGQLDLPPFGFPPGYFVKGPKEMIQQLSRELTLEDKHD